MFDRWLKLPAHYYLRITALILLIVGVALSNVLMSIGAIWIISNWLIEAKFQEYIERLKNNPALIIILIYITWSVLSLIWSEDLKYALADLRIKLPLLAIPLALGSGQPIEKKLVHFLLFILIGIVAFTSGFNFIRFHFFTEGTEIREMSWFISQIRFATLINIAFFGLIYLMVEKKIRIWIALPLLIWFGFYTLHAQVINGYILFGLLSFITFFYLLKKLNQKTKWFLITGFAAMFFIGTLYLTNILKKYEGLDQFKWSELDFYTVNGNPYFHDTTNHQTENGHYIWMYVNQYELEREWNKRSKISYDSTDRKGQPMYGTLMRYMTSKDIRKDSLGVWSLSDNEITSIENGKTSVKMNSGIEHKIHAMLFEYEMYIGGADPNGFSFLQRIEHLKAAKNILKENWISGVGIGDVNQEFQKYYETTESKLLPENRLRSHNQFLSSWIALGLAGLILMILFFVIPFAKIYQPDFLTTILITALLLSFLFEDTLETQAGVTIFSLFYSLSVFRCEVLKR